MSRPIDLVVKADISGLEKYSYSKLSSIWQCPYAYDLTYNRRIAGDQNGFAECGSLVHLVLEKYFKGELLQFELKDYFLSQFDSCVPNGVKLITSTRFPVDLTEKYKTQICSFLETFHGFKVGNKKIEVIEVEKQFTFVVNLEGTEFLFTGILDIVGKDKDGNYYILDHKSKADFKTDEERKEYSKQLYAYSMYVKHHYGKFPKAIVFDMFRANKLDVIPFSLAEYSNALLWIKSSVKRINDEELFLPLDFSSDLKQFQKWKEEYDNIGLSYSGPAADANIKSSYRASKKSIEDKLFFCMNLCNHSELCDAWKEAQQKYEEIVSE